MIILQTEIGDMQLCCTAARWQIQRMQALPGLLKAKRGSPGSIEQAGRQGQGRAAMKAGHRAAMLVASILVLWPEADKNVIVQSRTGLHPQDAFLS